jgi:hypothetical protein
MSFTNYRVFRITDEHINLELQLNSQNEHDFKCTVSFEKEMYVTGYPPLMVKPTCVCENIDNSVTTNVEITHELLEDINFVVEEPFERNFNDDEPVDHPVEDVVENVVEKAVNEVAEEVAEEVVEEVVDEVVKEVVVEVVEEGVHESDEQSIEETVEESDAQSVEEVIAEVIAEDVAEETMKIGDITNQDINEILLNFDKHMELIMHRLESIEKLEENRQHQHHAPEIEIVEPTSEIMWEEHKTESGYTYWWNRDTDESVWTNPHFSPHPPEVSIEKNGETIVEVLKPMASRAPTPPPRTPTPVSTPPPQEEIPLPPPIEKIKPHPPPPMTKPVSPLIAKIKQIQSLYINVPGVEKELIQIVLNHMRGIEHFDISGEEKKNIVINSIETILGKNNVADVDLILSLSSQLIDAFIALDKQTLKIENKKPNALSCFVCQ